MMEDAKLDQVSEHLRQSGALNNYQGKEAPVENEVAYSLSDIAESSRRIAEQIFPRIVSPSTPETYLAALEEFRDEIRHIVYHIRDTEYLAITLETVAE
jgi:hypothetical protein